MSKDIDSSKKKGTIRCWVMILNRIKNCWILVTRPNTQLGPALSDPTPTWILH